MKKECEFATNEKESVQSKKVKEETLSSFSIHVKWDGAVFSIEASKQDSVKTLKSRIKKKIGVRIRDQVLYHQSRPLHDSLSLKNTNIQKESIIFLTGRIIGGA